MQSRYDQIIMCNCKTIVITSRINSIHIVDSNAIQLLNSAAFSGIECVLRGARMLSIKISRRYMPEMIITCATLSCGSALNGHRYHCNRVIFRIERATPKIGSRSRQRDETSRHLSLYARGSIVCQSANVISLSFPLFICRFS